MSRQLLVGALAVLGLLLGTGIAFAHNVLVSSDPANGASLPTGPSWVTLRFDLPVQPAFSTVTVVGPDELHYEAGPARVDGSTVSAPVNPLGPSGRYAIGYRIVSDDGHPVSGSVSFRLTSAGTGHGVTATADSGGLSASGGGSGGTGAGAGSGAGSGSGGVPVWPWVLGGVLLLVTGVGIALRVGRE